VDVKRYMMVGLSLSAIEEVSIVFRLYLFGGEWHFTRFDITYDFCKHKVDVFDLSWEALVPEAKTMAIQASQSGNVVDLCQAVLEALDEKKQREDELVRKSRRPAGNLSAVCRGAETLRGQLRRGGTKV
jgi:hypothetical protein